MIPAWWLAIAVVLWPAWLAAGVIGRRLSDPPAGRHSQSRPPTPQRPPGSEAAQWLGFDPALLPRIDRLTPAQQLDALVLLGDLVPAAVGQVLELLLPKQPAR